MTPNPYPIGNVVSVDIYDNDCVVHRCGSAPNADVPPRSEITEFSYKSRQRLAFIAANTSVQFSAMVTLTYPKAFPSDGREVKAHFRAFLEALRRKCASLSYLWFIEWQKRGAPHFHILLKGLYVTDDTKGWVSETWYRIVGSNDQKHLKAGTRLERIRLKDGAKRYAVKYAHKMKQKRVPEGYRNVGRFWGHSVDVKPQPQETIECNEDDIIAALEMGGWPYLKGDTLWYKTLYGTSEILTRYFCGGTLAVTASVETDDP